MSETASVAAACPYCLSPIGAGEATQVCPACHAVYHQECWVENGGCAVYGCSQVPQVESRRGMEIPVSYWGQENKPCPVCGQQILAAALRCRHCGATFTSARPEDAVAFSSRAALQERMPAVRRTVVWIFVLSVIPFLAPIGAVWGGIWMRGNRDDLAALPPVYGALARIGLVTAIAFTVALVVLTAVYATIGHA